MAGGVSAACELLTPRSGGASAAQKVVFRVEHLPGSEHGPLIDRDLLRRFGAASAPKWRGFLRLAYLWDAAKGRNNGRPNLRHPPRGGARGRPP